MSLNLRDSAMDSSVMNERVLEILKEAVGRTTSARGLSDKLGHSHNYVRRIFSGEIPLQISTLMSMLQQLGLPPRIFFDQVFESLPMADPVAVLRFYREGDGLPRDPFLDEIGPRITRLAERPVDPDAAVESRRQELDRLEEQRFEDRDGAKLALESLIREIVDQTEGLDGDVPSRHVADMARACAIWATIQRVSGYRDNACDMYELAFACIQQEGRHQRTAAECYQKAAYLLRDLAAAEAGLQFLRIASDFYLRSGDLECVGKVLVDNGHLLYHLREIPRAMGEWRAALKILPSDSFRNRATAFASLARCFEAEGQMAAAIDHIREASNLYSDRVDIVAAQILVIRANIAGKLDLGAEAEECFSAAMKIYEQAGHPGYVLYVGLDYASWLLASGQTGRLSALADEMFSLAKYFRKNRLIDAALMEFVRMAKWGELTEEILRNTRRRLEAASDSLGFRSTA